MNKLRNTALLAGALAVVGTAVIATTDVGFAKEGRQGMYGQHHRMAMRGHGHGHGGQYGHRGGARFLMERFDTNGDGEITQEEIDAVQTERFSSGDADSNNGLTLEEFQTIWLQEMRERMVDRFQDLDADGDGTVTTEEFNARTSRLIQRLDSNGDGVLSRPDRPRGERRGPGRGQGRGPMMQGDDE